MAAANMGCGQCCSNNMNDGAAFQILLHSQEVTELKAQRVTGSHKDSQRLTETHDGFHQAFRKWRDDATASTRPIQFRHVLPCCAAWHEAAADPKGNPCLGVTFLFDCVCNTDAHFVNATVARR